MKKKMKMKRVAKRTKSTTGGTPAAPQEAAKATEGAAGGADSSPAPAHTDAPTLPPAGPMLVVGDALVTAEGRIKREILEPAGDTRYARLAERRKPKRLPEKVKRVV